MRVRSGVVGAIAGRSVRHRGYYVAAGLVAVLMAGMLSMVLNPAVAGTRSCPSAVESEAVARAAAEACGARVEILGARSEYGQVFANSDGTNTVEVASAAQRVRRPNGMFVPVDPTLVVSPDGGVQPVATAIDVRLSAGGGTALLSVGRGGSAVRLSWSQPLPVPVLTGNVAIYPNTPITDVDLQVKVSGEAVATVFVVKTRRAAADPALRSLRFGLATTGLTAQTTGGTVSWLDATGRPVFATGTAAMWDSAVDASPSAPATKARASSEKPAGIWAPGPAARRAEVPVRLEPDGLTVTPAPDFLSDTHNTYPLIIDPTVSRHQWSMINSTFPDQEYVLNGYDAVEHMKVGYTNVAQPMVYRSMVSFVQGSFVGKHVLGATLRSKLLHSWDLYHGQCPGNRITTVSTVGAFSATTNWNNHSGTWGSSLASTPSQNCTDAAGVYTEWGSSALTSYVNGRAAANAKVYLGLAGSGTQAAMGWKKFDENDTKLLVTYNSYPSTPTALTAQSGTSTTAKACVTGAGRPAIGMQASGTVTPILKAKVSDPDAETDLKAKFTWEKDAAADAPGWTAGGTFTQSGLSVNATGQFTMPAGLLDGDLVRWKAQTLDPWSFGSTSGTDSSAESGWCELRVDAVRPGIPDVDSVAYPDDGSAHGSAGVTGQFTLRANGSGDVTRYLWGWQDPPTTSVAAPGAGADLSLPLTPPPPQPTDPSDGGQLSLYVRAVDAGDNVSDTYVYVFLVGQAAGLIGKWDLSTTDGTTAVSPLADTNDSGTVHPLTGSGLTTGVAGRTLSGPGRAALTATRFNATTSLAATTGPVLNTSQSFTVAAWVLLDATGTYQTAVSQDGNQMSVFRLGHRADDNKWCFTMRSVDLPGAALTRACGPTPTTGKWTHLAGVYDLGSGKIRLYVNGVLAVETTYGASWNAAGSLAIGRARDTGAVADRYAGAIAEVRVWNRVLVPAEIAPLAATPAGRWRLETDGSEPIFGRTATATGAVQWVSDGQRGDVLSLDGASSLDSAGPALLSNQSFTVMAWVKLNATGGGNHSILSEAGSRVHAFWLLYNGTNWAFRVVSQDVDNAAGSTISTPATTDWTHLTGVWDAPAKTMRLYVNGVQTNSAIAATPFQATGPFSIGRVRLNGAYASYFNGLVDDVRVYSGAMPVSEIQNVCAC